MDENNPVEFYKKLKEQLTETSKWPSNYLYKFIVETETDKIDRINTIFDNMGAVIDLKKSKNGKYTSVSIRVDLASPDEVIAKYKEVGAIEGVISL
ncbi:MULTISPECIES: DUF493 family protein [Maribacter]|jgi:putative lipoic acid-binding regulatory protein|uniref:DUF493 domain-containing protein n=1 Tax=Maribacter stanieri TaxID=440514 RepID=A0A1I6JZ94_9FLAO|nr:MULTISPECIES: DUF493 family protein [Maribacter]SFR84198.1 hypothetical protein SAMN04488010_3261 [Maribacter stanieri]|tara:strand:- start:7629 stop:7916 length:288 start_codon:yes stop_codon:yes gene_type:complete